VEFRSVLFIFFTLNHFYMMTAIFFGIAFGFLAYEFYKLFHLKTIIYLNQGIKSVANELPDKDNYKEDMKSIRSLALINFYYWIWLLLGLITSQAILFGPLIIFELFHKGKKVTLFLDGVFSILAITFILLNHFYLHLFWKHGYCNC